MKSPPFLEGQFTPNSNPVFHLWPLELFEEKFRQKTKVLTHLASVQSNGTGWSFTWRGLKIEVNLSPSPWTASLESSCWAGLAKRSPVVFTADWKPPSFLLDPHCDLWGFVEVFEVNAINGGWFTSHSFFHFEKSWTQNKIRNIKSVIACCSIDSTPHWKKQRTQVPKAAWGLLWKRMCFFPFVTKSVSFIQT